MKSFFLIIVIFLTHFTLSHASKYDGAYTYTHFCKGEDSSKYDGSQFIIDDGILSNNRGGAGRWIIKKKFKVSDDGKLLYRCNGQFLFFSFLIISYTNEVKLRLI